MIFLIFGAEKTGIISDLWVFVDSQPTNISQHTKKLNKFRPGSSGLYISFFNEKIKQYFPVFRLSMVQHTMVGEHPGLMLNFTLLSLVSRLLVVVCQYTNFGASFTLRVTSGGNSIDFSNYLCPDETIRSKLKFEKITGFSPRR